MSSLPDPMAVSGMAESGPLWHLCPPGALTLCLHSDFLILPGFIDFIADEVVSTLSFDMGGVWRVALGVWWVKQALTQGQGVGETFLGNVVGTDFIFARGIDRRQRVMPLRQRQLGSVEVLGGPEWGPGTVADGAWRGFRKGPGWEGLGVAWGKDWVLFEMLSTDSADPTMDITGKEVRRVGF